MGVDHRRADVPMPKQFLNCPDVVAALQQMRPKRMAQLVEIAAGGTGGRAPDSEGTEIFTD
jgi:hypothetical protein